MFVYNENDKTESIYYENLKDISMTALNLYELIFMKIFSKMILIGYNTSLFSKY